MSKEKKDIIGKAYGIIELKEGEFYRKGQKVDIIFSAENIFEVDSNRSKAVDRAINLFTNISAEKGSRIIGYAVLDIDIQEIENSSGTSRRVQGYIHDIHAYLDYSCLFLGSDF